MKKVMGILLSVVMLCGTAGCAFAAFDPSSEITVVSREEGSGTRGAFVELLKVEKKDESGNKVDYTTEEAIITNNTAVMMTTVSGNESASRTAHAPYRHQRLCGNDGYRYGQARGCAGLCQQNPPGKQAASVPG